jgi:hypothetical protein
MITKRFLLVPAAALALLVAGCGDDDDKSSEPTASNQPAQTKATPDKPAGTTEEPAPSEAPAGGEDAVKQVILDFTFEGSCDTMTDKFLETQAFIGETRQERCDYFEKTFQKPQYKESDVKFRKVSITGDKAVVTIGSDIATIESDYTLVAADGKWQIDEVDIG